MSSLTVECPFLKELVSLWPYLPEDCRRLIVAMARLLLVPVASALL